MAKGHRGKGGGREEDGGDAPDAAGGGAQKGEDSPLDGIL